MGGKVKTAEMLMQAAATILAGMLANQNEGGLAEELAADAFDLATLLFGLTEEWCDGIDDETWKQAS